MFVKLASMLCEGDSLSITIVKKGDKLITSIIPVKAGLNDGAKEHITPMIVSGTPEELEEGFIDTVCAPIQVATGILTNMLEFEKSANAAQANSKAIKSEEDKKRKETEVNKKKYDAAIKQADEREKEGKLREAIAALNEANKYAVGNHGAISGRISKLKARLGSNSIFGELEEEDFLPVEQSVDDTHQDTSDEKNEDNEKFNEEEE